MVYLHLDNVKVIRMASGDTKGCISEEQFVFETELCWCVAQLQLGLQAHKPDSKQAKEATKILKLLANPNTPFIRKRQLMRTTFGDYRQKMANEDKQMRKQTTRIKLKSAPPNNRQASTFYRKARFQNTSNIADISDERINLNLPEDPGNDSSQPNNTGILPSQISDTSLGRFVYKKSDNSFRFSFSNIDERGDR